MFYLGYLNEITQVPFYVFIIKTKLSKLIIEDIIKQKGYQIIVTLNVSLSIPFYVLIIQTKSSKLIIEYIVKQKRLSDLL